ncbi:patatin-like phospholipase family protein [Chthonobacter rhizosphaerae]|uniref:patatin-like phospholipase family protein n=1 Tax=Chthonobacter rhizosphaerae TaxID=2735553 RepID=UPI0015EF954C|nr:patatin-like phospholipase family protein [Chthonobacter rhizosphaerae]
MSAIGSNPVSVGVLKPLANAQSGDAAPAPSQTWTNGRTATLKAVTAEAMGQGVKSLPATTAPVRATGLAGSDAASSAAAVPHKAWQAATPNALTSPPSATAKPGGAVDLQMTPPEIRELSFAGGGGKGAALAGAIKALEEGKVLNEVKTVYGTSVGSLAAACVAAGMTADRFQKLLDETDMTAVVGLKFGSLTGHSGVRLEALVAREVKQSVADRILSLEAKVASGGASLSAENAAALKAIKDRLLGPSEGVTFRDLSTLSKFVPGIKELQVTGTMVEKPGDPKMKPELFMFNAQTTPDLDVASAVHASAALPPVFKPVTLSIPGTGDAVFRDGGIRNNLPTSSTVGTKPTVDPLPTEGRIAIDFQNDAMEKVKQGTFKRPENGIANKVMNLFAGAKENIGQYLKNIRIQKSPDDLFVVQLKVEKNGKKKDFSGFYGGTVNFNISEKWKATLNDTSYNQMKAFIENRRAPSTVSFASRDQMLNRVDARTLDALAMKGEPGAADAVKFREAVGKQLSSLEATLRAVTGTPSGKIDWDASSIELRQALKPGGALAKELKALDDLAGGSSERLALIGREAHRAGGLLAEFSARPAPVGSEDTRSLARMAETSRDLKAQSLALQMIEDPIARKLLKQGKGTGGTILEMTVDRLLNATTFTEVKAALTDAIKHFDEKPDHRGRNGHKPFAMTLQGALNAIS